MGEQKREEHEGNKDIMSLNEEATETKEKEAPAESVVDEKERLVAELQETNEKYLRLYAEFENYKKRVNRDKEELVKYGNENLIYELLPVIDNLEMALKHSTTDASSGLVQGVELTLKELQRTLEKFGLTPIESVGRPFDPLVHHAMAVVERDDMEDKTVIEEFRKGYMLKDKVLRAPLVSVSKKPVQEEKGKIEEEQIKIIEEEM